MIFNFFLFFLDSIEKIRDKKEDERKRKKINLINKHLSFKPCVCHASIQFSFP